MSRRVIGWALAAGVSLIASVPLIQLSPTRIDNWVLLALHPLIPATFAVLAFLHFRHERSAIWLLITLFAAGCTIGQVGWSLSGAISGPSAQLSPADVFYLASLPLGIVGLLSFAFRGVPRGARTRIFLDSTIVVCSLMLILWNSFFAKSSIAGTLTDATRQSLAFPLLDALAAALAVTAAIYQPHRRPLQWLAGSTLIAAASDSMSLLRPIGAPPSNLLYMAWIAAPLALVATAATADAPGQKFSVTTIRRTWLSYIVVIASLSGGFALLRDGLLDDVAIWFGIALLISVCTSQAVQFREVRILIQSADAASKAYQESERRFRSAFNGAPVGIAVVDGRHIRSVNPALAELLGRPVEDLIGIDARDIIDFETMPETTEDDWLHLTNDVEGFHREFSLTRPDGVPVWLHMTVARQPADDGTSIAIIQDVTDRRAAVERLAQLAVHDPLTGLVNRATFVSAVDRCLGHREPIAIAFIDLDRFKVVNDSLGHAAGDRLLTSVSVRLRAAVDEGDVVARFAGDEFTVLIRDGSRANVEAVVARISSSLRMPVALGPQVVTHPTASIGVTWAQHDLDTEQLIVRADAAMYRAKAYGRNRVEYDAGATDHAGANELEVVSDLHRALVDQELVLHYQPVVDLVSGHTVGYEALVRWAHPTRGLLPPQDFIGVAEASGLILPLGEWVLREALSQLARWDDRWPDRRLTMSVNVSAQQIGDDFVELLRAVIADSGVEPNQIWLELTETTLMIDSHTAERVLNRIADMGVHLTVDDFGTGYSSLSYLHRFPMKGLKLDRSFVDGLGTSTQDAAICQAVVSLAHAMELKVVAEGIETRAQLDRLSSMGCTFGQGWFFGRAVPAETIEATIAV